MSYKQLIDREATLEEALDEGYYIVWDDHNYQDMLMCSKDGPVMQPSIFIDNGNREVITKISKQMPLDFYINQDGERVEIKPTRTAPYLITVFDVTGGRKRVFEAVEVAKDVPFNPDELGEWNELQEKENEEDDYTF